MPMALSASVSISGLQLKPQQLPATAQRPNVAGTTYQVGDKLLNQATFTSARWAVGASSNRQQLLRPRQRPCVAGCVKLVGAASSSSGGCATTTIPAAASNLNAVMAATRATICLSGPTTPRTKAVTCCNVKSWSKSTGTRRWSHHLPRCGHPSVSSTPVPRGRLQQRRQLRLCAERSLLVDKNHPATH